MQAMFNIELRFFIASILRHPPGKPFQKTQKANRLQTNRPALSQILLRPAPTAHKRTNQNKNLSTSLKFAQISKPNSKNIPATWAYSKNLSLGLRRAIIS